MHSGGKPLGIAMIGTGMVARTHVLAIRDAAMPLRLAGVMSRHADRARAFAAAAAEHLGHGVSVFRSFGDMRRRRRGHRPDPDAARRARIPDRAAGAGGKGDPLEKPVGRNLAEAEEVVAICERAGVPLGVVFQHRMREASQAALALVRGGTLGALGLAEISVPWWREQAYYDEPGRGTYARDGGGVLISQAIHTIDLALTLTGPVASVRR
jgi:predicted dehydrogenase